jgi:protein ImuB
VDAAACWACRFGTPVTVSAERYAVWVEVGRSLALFDGWPNLAAAITRSADGLPYRSQFGVAPTLGCSLLLAAVNAGLHQPVHRISDIPAAIARLPLMLLPIPEESRLMLRGAGLRRIAEVLVISAPALGRRLDADARVALDRLLGKAPETWQPFELPVHYRRRFEFSDPVETSEALLFPLKMMLGDFENYLCARDAAVQEFTVRLLDSRQRVILQPVGLLSPSRDPARLLLILREQLNRLTLKEGILEVAIEADRFEPAAAIQDDFFGSSISDGQRFTALCERLAARLGLDVLRQIAVGADQRPEGAMATPGPATVPGTRHPPRPVWLLQEPRRITPTRLLGPPERIELGWWDGDDRRRDYFLAEDCSGRVCWVYRDAQDGNFYLHGLWQ